MKAPPLIVTYFCGMVAWLIFGIISFILSEGIEGLLCFILSTMFGFKYQEEGEKYEQKSNKEETK